jgi:hypothetical protein
MYSWGSPLLKVKVKTVLPLRGQISSKLVGPQAWSFRLGPGVHLAPRDELCPLGGLFTDSFTPRGEHSLMFRRMKQWSGGFHPWGVTSSLGELHHPWEPYLPLGAYLKTGLCPPSKKQVRLTVDPMGTLSFAKSPPAFTYDWNWGPMLWLNLEKISKNAASLCKCLIVSLVLKQNDNFYENIAWKSDHNSNPWSQCLKNIIQKATQFHI